MSTLKTIVNVCLGLIIFYQACFGLTNELRLPGIRSVCDLVENIEWLFLAGYDHENSGSSAEEPEFPADENEAEEKEEKDNKDDKDLGHYLSVLQLKDSEILKKHCIHTSESLRSTFLKVLVPPPDCLS